MNALTLCNACDSAEATTPAGYCTGCDTQNDTTATLTTCTEANCTAEFFHVPARQFPNLCLDHAAIADREANGWNPYNSVD